MLLNTGIQSPEEGVQVGRVYKKKGEMDDVADRSVYCSKIYRRSS